MTKNEELLTVKEAAEVLRVSSRTIERLIKKEVLRAYKPFGSRKVLIKRSALYKYIEGSELQVT